MSSLRAALALVVLAACGGRYGGASTTPTGTAAKAPTGGLDASALPYEIVDARTGRAVDAAVFWTRVAAARAVCVGEEHTNAHHHWVQLEVTRHIIASRNGARLALGLEMVQRPFQGVLDDYAAKRIDAETLRSRTGWEERWGYDWGFYANTIDAAVAAGAQLLALNAPKELTKKAVRKGLESLTPEERAQVPELQLDDKAHRAWFDTLMDSMGGEHAHTAPTASTPEDDAPAPPMPVNHPPTEMPSAERIYTVQVMWDESMADGTARWLAANATGHAIILAGNGHCHDTAIVNRIKRRGVRDAISVRPVMDMEGQVAEALAKPINDYLVVLKLTKEQRAKLQADAKTAE